MRGTDDGQPELALLARVAAGDEDALHDLYTRLRPRLWRYLWRELGGDRPLIEDTLQEIFLAIWRSAGSFRGEARVSTWVFQIARYLMLRARHTSMRREETFSANDDEGSATSNSPWRQESFEDAALDRVAFAEALQHLSPKHRETLELVYFGGFTLDEAAAILSIPTGTVKSRISFARQALLRVLGHTLSGSEQNIHSPHTRHTRKTQQEAHHDA